MPSTSSSPSLSPTLLSTGSATASLAAWSAYRTAATPTPRSPPPPWARAKSISPPFTTPNATAPTTPPNSARPCSSTASSSHAVAARFRASPAEHTKAAVIIDGNGAGSIFYLCQTEKCDVHNRVTRYQPTPQEQAQRKKEAVAERVEKLSRVRILEGIRKKLPDLLSRADLEMVALDYFRRLGHDNHRRLSKLYAWEEKKSKTSWGAQAVDYEKIAAAAVQAMKTADLHRFLVVCALASDLYCPSYNPRQSLAKDSNLIRTAVRYKIDTAKLSATVREELSKSGKATAPKKSKTTKTKLK